MLARFPRRPGLTLVGAVALVIAIANPAAAPPGDLDTTFDGDGKVTTDFGSFDNANAVALQGDGKIVAAGYAESSFDFDLSFALARYNADGSLDPTFDGDGLVNADPFPGNDEARAVAIQGDGKIVAAGGADSSGTGNEDFFLGRLNTDGSFDTTFGGDGFVTTDFVGSTDRAFAVAIQGDGKILAAGFASVPGAFNFALARYNTDGSPDPTFDGDGRVTTDFDLDTNDEARAVAIQGDGKIVAAGLALVPGGVGDFDFALARYNTGGSLDTTFDVDGKVTTDFGSFDQAYAVAIQGDGKIMAGGVAGSGGDFALARYTTNGSLDPIFSGDGKVTTDFAGDTDQANGVAIQGDGKLVAAGCTSCFSSASDFALARYNTDGSLDTIFSGDGRVTTDFAGSDDQAFAVAIQGDRKIVAAGHASVSGTNDFALARYTVCRRTSRASSIPFCP